MSLSVWLSRHICFLQTVQVANGQLNETHASHLQGLAFLISSPDSYCSPLTYALLMATGRRHSFHAMMSLCCLSQQLASLSCTPRRNNDKIAEESSLGHCPGEPRLPHHIPDSVKKTALPRPSGRKRPLTLESVVLGLHTLSLSLTHTHRHTHIHTHTYKHSCIYRERGSHTNILMFEHTQTFMHTHAHICTPSHATLSHI